MISENEKIKIEKIVDNLKNITHFNISYLPQEKIIGKYRTDGQIKFCFSERKILKNIEYKPRIQANFLEYILIQLKTFNAEILLSDYISPAIAQTLRKNNIQYIDGTGNAFISDTNFYLLIDGNKPDRKDKPEKFRLFQESGLKCLFHFFVCPTLINQTQREIQAKTGLSLGSISYVFRDLKKLGYLIAIDKDKWEFVKRKKLLERWLVGFEEILRPKLLLKTYQFVKKDALENWRDISIEPPMNYWGGEPAGDVLTNFLIPEKYTIYTRESRQEVMQKFKILPSEKGNVEVLNCFWNEDIFISDTLNTVPPLLVYADLLISGDSRNYEVAQRIYEKYLSDFFESY